MIISSVDPRRVEAFRDAGQGEVLEWGINAFTPPEGAEGDQNAAVLLLGHLQVGRDGHWGQVLVSMQVSSEDEFPHDSAAAEFAESAVTNLSQMLYEKACQVLSLNAVLLGIDYALPAEEPEVRMEVGRATLDED